jgi:uncharacterized iron-regulated membrane protein
MPTSVALVAIMGMLVSFGLPLALVAIVLMYKQRKLRMSHETIAKLAEKGLPVPPELLERPSRHSSGTLRGGLVLIALGIALSILLTEVGGPWSVGLIPGLMGVALLLSWAIEKRLPPN